MQWLTDAIERLQRRERIAFVTVAGTKGSAPREAGAKMLVTADDMSGTIGGGALELRAMERARTLLAEETAFRQHEPVSLGPALGQCCGGNTELVFESVDSADLELFLSCRQALAPDPVFLVTPLVDPDSTRFCGSLDDMRDELRPLALMALEQEVPALIADAGDDGSLLIEVLQERRAQVWLFGAGHVGRAIARALVPLPFHLTWVDDRPGFLPDRESDDVRPVFSREPHLEVAAIPAGALVLIMSHSHPLDFQIAEAALRRDDLAFVGLIGSKTKRAQFLRRARAHGLAQFDLDRLVSPIGLPEVKGKEPAVIAASVAVQLLQVAEVQAVTGRDFEPLPAKAV